VSKATLLVIAGFDQGSRFEIQDQPAGIGRGLLNAIRLYDTEASRRHAKIECTDGSYTITDLKSSNGTYVNGKNVRSTKVANGDQIQIGRTTILFSTADEERAATHGAAGKVDFVGRLEADDRSSIVAQVDQDAGRQLLENTATIAAPDMWQMLDSLQVLYRISEEAVRPSLSLEQLLQRILDLTLEVIGADRGCMFVTDMRSGDLTPRVFSHRAGVDASATMPVSRGIVDYVVTNGQGVRTTDARTDQRFGPRGSILQAGIREAMCVPMQGRYELMGVIYLDTTMPHEQLILRGDGASQFSEEQLRLLVAIGRQSALAIEDHRYQDAFVKAERLAAVGQTVASLSHHIKNILQGVRGGSYLIDMGLNQHSEELIGKGWRIVEKNQDKIYHLVMDMLTYSTERQPALQLSNLNDTVEDIHELMQARAEECGVRLESDLATDLIESTFDPEGIHRAVLNIVGNGIDAVEDRPDGIVLIRTGHDEQSDELYVEVLDNGPGIPPEQLAHIFIPFESSKGARGTGLGLAVSRKIIREHGGDISVFSTPDRGCRFRLAWPRLDDERRAVDGKTQSQ
jgi:two-component system, NtrC family, sensor kinase